jgi:hypothetical protein
LLIDSHRRLAVHRHASIARGRKTEDGKRKMQDG